MVVGDYNLHHPEWNSGNIFKQEAASEDLIRLAAKWNLLMATQKGIPTRRVKNSESTIDLTFMQPELFDALLACDVREDLHHGSDHLPVVATIELEVEEVVAQPRRAWKTADPEKVAKAAAEINLGIPELRTTEAVDQYLEDIIHGFNQVIEKAVPLAKPGGIARSFWNVECTRATKNAAAARKAFKHNRCDESWEAVQDAVKIKGKVVRRARTLDFRRRIHESALSRTGVWALSKHACLHSRTPKALPKFHTLATEQETAETFEQKDALLRKRLFPPSAEAKLDDIPGTIYPPEIPVPDRVLREEVVAIIGGLKPEKALGVDGIPNRMLKMVVGEWSTYFTHLFQACVLLRYHPTHFKRENTVIKRC